MSGPALNTNHDRHNRRFEQMLWRVWFAGESLPWWHYAWLWPLGLIYRRVVRFRGVPNRSIEHPPVIVVGNLIAGGAGKTPIVAAICKALKAQGYTPGIITRGYRRQTDANVTLLLDPTRAHGQSVQALAQQFGDEPAWLFHETDCPVAVGAKRALALKILKDACPAVDVVVSDDGLQHKPLARAYEIVVFDDRAAGNGLLLPLGPLREPLDRLKSVDAVLAPTPAVWLIKRLPSGETPVFSSRLEVTGLEQWSTGKYLPLTDWLEQYRGQTVCAMAGMGHPGKFFALINKLGIHARGLSLPDHYAYPENFLQTVDEDIILTTGKDAVKLPKDDPRLWVVNIKVTLPDGLVHHIKERLFGS